MSVSIYPSHAIFSEDPEIAAASYSFNLQVPPGIYISLHIVCFEPAFALCKFTFLVFSDHIDSGDELSDAEG